MLHFPGNFRMCLVGVPSILFILLIIKSCQAKQVATIIIIIIIGIPFSWLNRKKWERKKKNNK